MSFQRRKLIKISSKDKVSYSVSNTDFEVQLGNATLQNAKAISIKQVNFRNFATNINKHNNTLAIDDGVSSLLVEIDVKQYDFDDFITELQTKLNVVISPEIVAITLNTDNFLSFTFSNSTFSLLVDNNPMAEFIGLCNDKTGSDIYVMDCLPQAGGIEEVFIYSNALDREWSFI
jgi:hypothetical protein